MGMPESGNGVIKTLVVSVTRPPLSKKPLTSACAFADKLKREWQVVDMARWKFLVAGSRSTEAPTDDDTDSLTPSNSSKSDSLTSYTDQHKQQKLKCCLL